MKSVRVEYGVGFDGKVGGGGVVDAERAAFRRELGIGVGVGGPVVMSGHQAGLWHAGILAKVVAMHALAKKAGGDACCAWVVVDQDETDVWAVGYPTQELKRGVWRLGPAPKSGVAVCGMGAVARFAGVPSDAHAGVRAGMEEMLAALRAGGVRDGESAAGQVTRAMGELVRARVGEEIGGSFRPFLASAIARTGAFARVVGMMVADAERVVGAYNAAVRAVPRARMRALEVGNGRVELPLWRVGKDGVRGRVFADELKGGNVEGLLPRALLMTLLLRAWGCECFVHGVGGGVYDRVTEMWNAGAFGFALAPTVVATATAVVDLGVGGERLVSPEDVARAKFEAQKARHHPGLVGDEAGQRERDALVAQIAGVEGRGRAQRAERRRMYRELSAVIERSRERNAGAIAAIEERARAMGGEVGKSAVVLDRTYAWPMLGAGTVGELVRAVESACLSGVG